MKATILMKIAVVFMAAFGAYAFSADTNSLSNYFYKDGNECTNVMVNCSDSGTVQCRVKLKSTNNVMNVWGLSCVQPIFHLNDQILEEI